MLRAALGTRRRRVAAVVLLAAGLRIWAALLLPSDFDEPVYIQAGYDYARLLRAGDLNSLIDYPQNREHPALVKLLYAGAVLALGPAASLQNVQLAGRLLSAAFGTLTVAAVTLEGGPLAGGLLAIHTLAVKFTSQAYLEALPLLTSTVAVLAFVRMPPRPPGETLAPGRWFWVSAIALGLTAAGKFTYLPAFVVIAYLATWEKNRQWREMLLYCLAAAAVFWLFDPTLWHSPITRLADAVFFHFQYAGGAHVEAVAYPWFQPLVWLSTSPGALWHPQVFFYYGIDGLTFYLGLAGIRHEWKQRRWLVVWLISGLLFLLVWPTKWPQYVLVVMPAVVLMAGRTVQRLLAWAREQEAYWEWLPQMLPAPSRWITVVTLAFVSFMAVIYLWGVLGVALGSIGWSHLTTQTSLVPSNTVYAVLALPDGRVVVGTDNGASLWLPPAGGDAAGAPLVFNSANSGLPGNQVLAVAQDSAGRLWFGTQAGAAVYDGAHWAAFRAADLGLANEQVRALAVDRAGRVYAGTPAGAAVWDGQAWTALQMGSGDEASILAETAASAAGSEAVWFGTLAGLKRLDTATGLWQSYARTQTGLSQGGIAALTVDSSGRLWAASLGGGVSVFDGTAWTNYRLDNSGLPYSEVTAVAEVRPGLMWLGTASPTMVGGTLAAFDGQKWRRYEPKNSGFSGAVPLAIALDARGQVWVATRTEGLDIYQLNR